jgi:hypothetical protein
VSFDRFFPHTGIGVSNKKEEAHCLNFGNIIQRKITNSDKIKPYTWGPNMGGKYHDYVLLSRQKHQDKL